MFAQHGVEISVARRGCPWENGYAERLIRTLKEEEVYLNDYQSITEARDRIGEFITNVYNFKIIFDKSLFIGIHLELVKNLTQ